MERWKAEGKKKSKFYLEVETTMGEVVENISLE